MGKKKFTFEQITEIRNNNHDEFLNIVFENFENRDFLSGEIQLKSVKEVEKDGVKKRVVSDKWIMFTPDEKSILVKMAIDKDKAEVDKILKEGELRYERALLNPMRIDAEDYEIGVLVCMAIEEGQTISEAQFKSACMCIKKHKEIDGPLWKSVKFKGFVRWNQIEDALKWYKERSNSRGE